MRNFKGIEIAFDSISGKLKNSTRKIAVRKKKFGAIFVKQNIKFGRR
jgi:hypothetical protein